MTDIKRGQVYWFNLKKRSVEHKQSGRRPIIIVQADELNESGILTTLIIPTTTKECVNDFDNVVLEKTSTPKKSIALCSNMQIIDRYKIKKENYICDVDSDDMKKIDEYIKNTLGM